MSLWGRGLVSISTGGERLWAPSELMNMHVHISTNQLKEHRSFIRQADLQKMIEKWTFAERHMISTVVMKNYCINRSLKEDSKMKKLFILVYSAY